LFGAAANQAAALLRGNPVPGARIVMTIGTSVGRLLFMATAVLSPVCSTDGVAAQGEDLEFEPTSYVTYMTEQHIDISGHVYEISDVLRQNYPDGENEQVFLDGTLEDDIPAYLEVTWLDDSDTPDETMELWVKGLAESEDIDDLEIVDAGLDGEVYWYFVTGSIAEQPIVFYIQVTEDVEGNIDMLESVLTIEGSLVDAVGAAQADIAIGDDAFLDDVDLDDLEGLIEGEPFRD
jgi:hypothetical protein